MGTVLRVLKDLSGCASWPELVEFESRVAAGEDGILAGYGLLGEYLSNQCDSVVLELLCKLYNNLHKYRICHMDHVVAQVNCWRKMAWR